MTTKEQGIVNNGLELSLRIDWSDMDQFGHVTNMAYIKYFQSSRIVYLDNAGLLESFEKNNIGPTIASIHCDYHKPLFYPGQVRVRTSVDFIKTTSFGITHSLFNDNNELVAEGRDIMVVYDFNKSGKCPIPDLVKKRIETIEKRNFS